MPCPKGHRSRSDHPCFRITRIAAVTIITVLALRRKGRLHHHFEKSLELSGPLWQVQDPMDPSLCVSGLLEVEKPKAQVVTDGLITSPMRNAIDWPGSRSDYRRRWSPSASCSPTKRHAPDRCCTVIHEMTITGSLTLLEFLMFVPSHANGASYTNHSRMKKLCSRSRILVY